MLSTSAEIDACLRAAKATGKLIPAKPVVNWVAERRAFLMCPPLKAAIDAGRESDDELERKRWAQLEADISAFIEGNLMTEKLIKQLKPEKYEHWELISRRPQPSIRVFGRFAKPDVFVGTHLVHRKKLKGMWSAEFEHEKLVCEDHWNLAGMLAPFSDPPEFRYEQYVTENAARTLKVMS